MFRIIILSVTLLVSASGWSTTPSTAMTTTTPSIASAVDHDRIYTAYLSNDMGEWGAELSRCSALPSLSADDRFALCNYYYGYVAYILDRQDKRDVERLISQWEEYISSLEDERYKPSSLLVFRSSIQAYRARMYPLKSLAYITRSINLLEKALETSATDPLAVGLKGNAKFYSPAIAGGSKTEAIKYFTSALTLLSADEYASDKVFRWNRCAMELCLAQAYEKTDQTAKALAQARKSLAREPRFDYMKNVFLPSIDPQ